MATNQYLQTQADNISQNMTRNFNTSVLPQINSGAMAAGGFGGSRHGIAQSLGMRGLNDSIGQAQTNLYSNAYNTDQSIQAQKDMQAASLAQQQQIASMQDATNRYGLGNQYNLGLGGLGLQNKGLDQNFYTNQRQQDISQMGLGAQLANQGNLGLSSQGSQLYQNGQTQQQAPWQQLGNLSSIFAPYTGLNSSQSQQTPGYSSLQGALAGAGGVAQILKLLGGG
jgi:hypothetical protein